MQEARQPLVNGRPLLPIRTPLAGRHSVRCKQCDHSLCKGEYSPASMKFKIQVSDQLVYFEAEREARVGSVILLHCLHFRGRFFLHLIGFRRFWLEIMCLTSVCRVKQFL